MGFSQARVSSSWPPYLLIVGVLVVQFLCFPAVLRAQQPTATIKSLSGQVLVSLQGQAPVAAAERTTLQAGDFIETKAGAQVVLLLSEGSELHLGQNTKLDIAALTQNQRTKARTSRLKLWYGRIRAFLSPGHQEQGSSFSVDTPNARAGVKFSEPDVEVMYDPETKTTIAWAYTVGMSVTNLDTGATAGDIPKDHQVIIHKAMIVVTKITDISEILEQMRDIPEIGASKVPDESPEVTMELLLETRENIGMITPVTSQIPTPGTRPDVESGPEPVEFTYTIHID